MHGGSLDTVIHKKRQISFERKIELLLDVVKGMIYLHGLEPAIVHRDLKPNVSVTTRTHNRIFYSTRTIKYAKSVILVRPRSPVTTQ
jgi:serine/threonine protein kinase